MKLAALIAAALLAAPAAASAAAPGLAPVASAAAGRAIVVTCTVPADATEAGYTFVGGSEVWLSGPACSALSHLARRDARWLRSSTDSVANTATAGAAIQALVHEATHLRLASGDEALVECTASRNYWPTIASFHLPASIARAVLAAATYTHQNLKASNYKQEC